MPSLVLFAVAREGKSKGAIMPEETPTPETELETPEVEEAAPSEPAPDPLAEEREAIARREKELQRGFDEIARRERELASKAPAPPEDDDVPEIPEETAKALEKFFNSKYGDKLRAVDNLYLDAVDNELSKRENPDAIKAVIAEYGFQPANDSIAAIRDVLDKAEAVAKAKSLNPDAIRAEAKAEAEKEVYARLAEQGIQVETIEPKRSDASPEANLDDDDLDSETKVRLLREKYPHL